jgi:hypothetical protein
MADSPFNIFYNKTFRSLKMGECCESISFDSSFDSTGNPAFENYPTDLTLYKEDCCGRRNCISQNSQHQTNYPITWDNLSGDGTYVLVSSVYIPNLDTTYTIELKVCADCCDKKRISLCNDVSNRMACISCKIQERKSVGRNVELLENDYLKLSNIYYLLNSTNCVGKIPLSCDEIELLKCSIKKIK